MRRALALLAVLGLALTAGAGCGKHKYGQYELDSSLHRYCIEIRWGRILKAAQHVAPEMRGDFVDAWSRRAGKVDIQDLEVVSMAVAGDGDQAMVQLRITWVDNQTLQIRNSLINQTWKRSEYGWLAHDTFDLEGRGPAPKDGAEGAGTKGEPGFGGG